MNEMTLREMCEACGVSRRAVQGYEKMGLVAPCGRTNRGYLLYDEDARKKVSLIKALQNYGFSVRGIADFLEKDGAVQREILREKLNGLIEKREKLDGYISEIEEMIEQCHGAEP